ncbi:MAG: DNA-processing protein DprA [Agrobacterium sp.]|nr:DNA-processing protein DprA [Agrobacterium sp.]
MAVVGSRDADDEDLAYTGRLGAEAAAQGYSLVSGGARGVDQSAMLGALESQGTAVGVLADSLLRSATSAKYRKHIMSGDLALISPFNPEAGFNVGHAMSRNRYIYCLADAAVVISSTRDKGGTWNGAIEDIRAGWVPLWVKPSSDRNSGNRELAQRGANWFPEDMTSLSKLFEETHSAPLQNLGNELPLIAQDNEREAESDKERKTETSTPGKSSPLSEPLVDASVTSGVSVPENSVLVDVDFYTLFLARIVEFASAAPMTVDDVAARLELEKAQVNAWLKRADNEGKVAKLTKPVRYIINPTAPRQAALFER